MITDGAAKLGILEDNQGRPRPIYTQNAGGTIAEWLGRRCPVILYPPHKTIRGDELIYPPDVSPLKLKFDIKHKMLMLNIRSVIRP